MLIKAIFFGQNGPLTLVALKGYTVCNSVCNEESNQNIKSYLTLMIFVQVLYNRASEVVNILICKSWNVVQYGDILVLEFFVWNQYRTIWNVEVIWRISPSNFLLDPFLQTQTSEKINHYTKIHCFKTGTDQRRYSIVKFFTFKYCKARESKSYDRLWYKIVTAACKCEM